MAELFDKDNNPVEGAMTAEEVEVKLTELKDSVAKETEDKIEISIKDKDEKITGLQKQLTDLNEVIDSKGDAGLNFKRLRDQKKELQLEIQQVKTDTTKQISDIVAGSDKKHLESRINDLSGGDDEVKKKINFFFEGLSENLGTVDERISQAVSLATGQAVSNVLSGKHVSGNTGGSTPLGSKLSPGKISDDAKKMGTDQFGLTDDDFKKAEEKGLI